MDERSAHRAGSGASEDRATGVPGGAPAEAGSLDAGPIDAVDEWHRVHPVSPIIRGWIVVLAFLGVLVSNAVESIFGGRGEGDGPRLSDQVDGLPGWASLVEGAALWIVVAVAAVIAMLLAAAVVALFSLFLWWFTRYQITTTHVRLRQGAIFRQERQTRLDRVQAIDIQRPLGPRIFGLAELRFEVADAGESSVVLRYLRHAEARRLRTELLGAIGDQPEIPIARARARADEPTREQAPDEVVAPWARQAATATPPSSPVASTAGAPDDEVFVLRVPTRRALLARVLTGEFIALALVAVTALVMLVVAPGVLAASFFGWIPALIGLVTYVVRKIEGSWGFRAHRTAKGLRLRYGLLNATSQTVPTGRIQALRVRRPLLWRQAGWSEVSINVAGYGGGEGQQSSRTVLIPVATDEHLRLMLAEATGESDAAELTETVLEGLSGDLTGDPLTRFTISPPRAARISWVVRRRRGFAVTPHEVVTVDGRLTRHTSIVPHGKIQSIGLRRGPLARWLKLSDVSLHSIPGPVSPTVACLDRTTAETFIAEQIVRSRAAHTLI